MFRGQFSTPSLALSQFIRFYAGRQVRNPGAAVVHPVPARPGPMIVFDFDDPIDVVYCNQQALVKSPRIVVVGPQTHHRVEMYLRGNLDTFVIMFQPDGLNRLFFIPMHELTDLDFDARSVLGSFIAKLGERLGNSRSFTERVRLVEEAFMPRALASAGIDGVSAAANRIILSGGRASIPALAARAGLSTRQFERKFIQQVGLRPRLFTRIARFEAALENKARSATRSWTAIAHEYGYYDQMHMVHDFAEFTGATPSETLAKLETVFVAQIRGMRSGPPSVSAQHDPRLIL